MLYFNYYLVKYFVVEGLCYFGDNLMYKYMYYKYNRKDSFILLAICEII